jgi:hypothetical protein
MVNPFTRVPASESGLATVTFRGAAVAPVRSKVQVIRVADTTTTFVAIISGPAEVFTNLAVAPDLKLVPARLVMLTFQPRTCVFGVIAVTVGVGVLTLNPAGSIPDWPSALVTTTFHKPGVAFAGREIAQVIRLEDPTLTPVAGISEYPVLLSLTEAPLTKPLPPTETGTTVEPTMPEEGDIALTNTPALFTKNPFGRTATLPSGLVTTIVRVPRDAPARSNVQLIRFWFTTATPDATISGADELLRITVAPFWKPDPARLVIIVFPVMLEFGLIPVTTGPGLLIMNPLGRIPD